MNRIITEEFLHETLEDSLTGLRIELNRFIDNYNSFRPHSSLQDHTPFCLTSYELVHKAKYTRLFYVYVL